MKVRKFIANIWVDVVSLIVIGIVFVVPFAFILTTAAKTRQEASLFQFSWPSNFQLLQNIQEVMAFGDYRMYLALSNSTLLTVGSVTLIVLFAALVAYTMQRRADRTAAVVSSIIRSWASSSLPAVRADDLSAAVDWTLPRPSSA